MKFKLGLLVEILPRESLFPGRTRDCTKCSVGGYYSGTGVGFLCQPTMAKSVEEKRINDNFE